MSRSLIVWVNNSIIGRITEDNDIWSFSYEDSWRDNEKCFSLSPAIELMQGAITDGSSNRPVQWFFDNLLPEAGAREILSREAGVDVSDSFGLLEYYGAESAGAITLLSDGVAYEVEDASIRLLSNDELSARIRNLPIFSLTNDAPKKMSLAGAQHKLAVNFFKDKSEIYEPSEKGISSHILKPDHPDSGHYYHTTINEWFIMRLAKRLGLNVPLVNLLFVPEPVYLIERFDRDYNKPGYITGRKHTVDGCQLLGLSRASKYTQADAGHLNRLIQLCRKKAVARVQIFNWIIFNTLIGNNDAHLKNLSFFIANNGVELTPFYDLLSTIIYMPQRSLEQELSYKLGNARFFSDVNEESILVFGENIGLARKAAAKYLNKMLDICETEFDILYQDYESLKLSERHGFNKAGALRMLREIKFNVLREMKNRMA